MRMVSLRKFIDAVIVAALLCFHGCSTSPEFVSEVQVEDKIARLRLGQSDKSEVESIFGSDRVSDRNFWVYQFADRQFEFSERPRGAAIGLLPVSAGVVPTNTRAVVTVRFNDAGILKGFEVARFFEEPFVNDYWYLIKPAAKEPLGSVAALGESLGFKVVGLDKTAGTFALEDPNSKARVAIKLDGSTLRATSRNPHHRQANEYRVYIKRESALANGIANSELVQ
jgi:hypothetical protein